MDNLIYKKVKNRYEPIGVTYHTDWLTDGLWLVRSQGGSRRTTSVPFLLPQFTKLSDVPKLTIDKLCGFDEYIDKVCDALLKMDKLIEMDNKENAKDRGYHVGMNKYDIAKVAVLSIFNQNIEIENIEPSKL